MTDKSVRLALDLLRWSGDRALVPAASTESDSVRWLADRKIDSLLYLSTGSSNPTQRFYNKVWNVQREELERVISALGQSSVVPLVFKGSEIIGSVYESRSINLLADIDLLIQRSELSRAKPIMYGLGYRQAIYDQESETLVDRDFADVAVIENTHYELAPFSRLVPISLTPDEFTVASEINYHPIWVTAAGDCFVAVEFDLHHGVATDLESQPFFDRAVESSFPGALTLSAADHVWFMTARFYNEVAIHGKFSLRDFAYIAPLLTRPSLDWDVVLGAASEFKIATPLYYYLTFLDSLNPGVVPPEALLTLNPLNTERLRDWGWQLERLFGLLPIHPFA